MSDLEGRVSLVVGAGVPGGIGEACSRALAEAGSKVVLADLPGTQLAEVAGYLEGTVAYHEVDITDEASVEELIAYTVATFGRLDVLDNNAAATALTPLDRDVHSMTTDVWDRTFAVNIRGPMLTCKHAIPIFIDQGAGTIINVSSGQSLRGDDFNPGYSASKAALNALTRSIAVHYGKQNIRCNAV